MECSLERYCLSILNLSKNISKIKFPNSLLVNQQSHREMKSNNFEVGKRLLSCSQETGNVSLINDQNKTKTKTKTRSDSPPLLKKKMDNNPKGNEIKLEGSQQIKRGSNTKTKKTTLLVTPTKTKKKTKTKKRFKFFKIKRKKTSKKKIIRLYKQYKDKKSGDIEAKGIKLFFNDLEIDILDVGALIISWKLNAQLMGMYTEKEFVDGWMNLGCDSLDKMKKKYFEIREEIEHDQQIFKQFYYWVFEFGKEETEKRVMTIGTATILWEILIKDKFTLFQNWIEFLDSDENKSTVITRDTWKVFIDFIHEINNRWENYDLTSSWPLLFDQFYFFMKK
ncbi:rp42 related [Anaeramoeba flamelloides]|uniref:Defective in cullin neddylation protein n=1 Tax=Anaeramoeba flamelloides TaxID=1746091 RepID=A0AAV7ZVZ6_9EUKA|nr:rp42 related [Anaeramoeba flamelloides]